MTNFEKNSIIECCVTGIEKYGIFVSIDNYYNGLIHISEVSDKYVKNINDYVNIGDTIYAKVLEIDNELFHIKLSIKNINYKKHLTRKNKIKENGKGFELLKENLEKWIEEKKVK